MAEELEIVRGFLERRLGIAPARIMPAVRLCDLDVNSMLLLELFFEFEDKLGLELSKCTATPKTVGDLLDAVRQMRAAKAAG